MNTGTRAIYGFKVDDKYFMTYCHDSGSIDYLGNHILRFLQMVNDDVNGWEILKKRVRLLTLVKNTSHASQALIERYERFADTSVSSGDIAEWYVLLRELQGTPYLYEIYNGNVEHLTDFSSLIKNESYTFIIDLDDMKFEAYELKDKVIEFRLSEVSDIDDLQNVMNSRYDKCE